MTVCFIVALKHIKTYYFMFLYVFDRRQSNSIFFKSNIFLEKHIKTYYFMFLYVFGAELIRLGILRSNYILVQ